MVATRASSNDLLGPAVARLSAVTSRVDQALAFDEATTRVQWPRLIPEALATSYAPTPAQHRPGGGCLCTNTPAEPSLRAPASGDSRASGHEGGEPPRPAGWLPAEWCFPRKGGSSLAQSRRSSQRQRRAARERPVRGAPASVTAVQQSWFGRPAPLGRVLVAPPLGRCAAARWWPDGRVAPPGRCCLSRPARMARLTV